MNKKKITLDEWTEIGKYNHAAKWVRKFCSYYLIKEPDGRFKREQRIGLIVYLVMFIPAHIIQAFWCMWDCGLKEFEIAERYLGCDWIDLCSPAYVTAEKIWNSK